MHLSNVIVDVVLRACPDALYNEFVLRAPSREVGAAGNRASRSQNPMSTGRNLERQMNTQRMYVKAVIEPVVRDHSEVRIWKIHRHRAFATIVGLGLWVVRRLLFNCRRHNDWRRLGRCQAHLHLFRNLCRALVAISTVAMRHKLYKLLRASSLDKQA
jgi:hypothetical protein